MCQIHKKLVRGESWAEVTGVTIWDHMMRGHDFWTHLKMCVIIFDLLPTVLESGTVSGEIGS